MNNYLFFLRHYNDIDNIVPAVFTLLKKINCKVTIVIYSVDYDYRSNQLLKFINDQYPNQVKIKWLGEALNYPYKVTSNKKYCLWNYRVRRLLGNPIIEKATRLGKNRDVIDIFLQKIFDEYGFPVQVIFDQNRSSDIAGILDSLRKLGVKRIISLPVSPWINVNVLRQIDFIKLDANLFKRQHDYSGFDEIGQVDTYYSDNLEQFFSYLGEESPFKGKVKVLGSLRFSNEWLDVLSSDEMKPYLPHALTRGKKPTVLILPSHPKNNSFWKEYERTLKFLSQFDHFDFVIKPHTRYNTAYKDLPNNMKLDKETSTSTMIDWADIILYWSTSVALEGFQKKKLMVCLDYLNGNKSLYSILNVGIICRSKDDLLKIFVPKSNNNIIKCLEDSLHSYQKIDGIIYSSGKDIEKKYLDFIINK